MVVLESMRVVDSLLPQELSLVQVRLRGPAPSRGIALLSLYRRAVRDGVEQVPEDCQKSYLRISWPEKRMLDSRLWRIGVAVQ